MIIRVAKDAMNKNKCTCNILVPSLKWMRAVDQDTRRLPRGLYPFRAI